MGNVTIEQIHTLWLAAEALVNDCPEPCWGLAQGLSEMAEQLVQAEPELGWPAGACAGCGGEAGRHAAGCIHAFDGAAEPDEGGEMVIEQAVPLGERCPFCGVGCGRHILGCACAERMPFEMMAGILRKAASFLSQTPGSRAAAQTVKAVQTVAEIVDVHAANGSAALGLHPKKLAQLYAAAQTLQRAQGGADLGTSLWYVADTFRWWDERMQPAQETDDPFGTEPRSAQDRGDNDQGFLDIMSGMGW